MYSDDTEIYASSKYGDELVANLNCDLKNNVRKWMLQNGLQIHPTKTKYMYIGSSYNIKNKISSNPILINNISVPRTIHVLALAWMKGLLGKNILIRFVVRLWQDLGSNWRQTKSFVPPETLKLTYEALVQPYFNYCSPL